MKRKKLRPKLSAPVDRTAIQASFKTDAIDNDKGIYASKYHVKFASDDPTTYLLKMALLHLLVE
ncbi:hypothetical protein Lepto7375DRAFT_5522 [Leptolyngbya sp. PCC 7375]|nr:hypothetical protein Lepto7375DRAFT_5522 [Leptolyngbya sp. PCC 7375]